MAGNGLGQISPPSIEYYLGDALGSIGQYGNAGLVPAT